MENKTIQLNLEKIFISKGLINIKYEKCKKVLSGFGLEPKEYENYIKFIVEKLGI